MIIFGLGGAIGLGVLVTVLAAAGSGAHGTREILAARVSASLTAASAFLVLALIITPITRPRRTGAYTDDRCSYPTGPPGTTNQAHPTAEPPTKSGPSA